MLWLLTFMCSSVFICVPQAFRSTKAPPLLVRLPRNDAILEEGTELLERERLPRVDERLRGLGMDIRKDQVGAGNDPLRGGVEDILQAVGSGGANADRVRRIDAHRHAR